MSGACVLVFLLLLSTPPSHSLSPLPLLPSVLSFRHILLLLLFILFVPLMRQPCLLNDYLSRMIHSMISKYLGIHKSHDKYLATSSWLKTAAHAAASRFSLPCSLHRHRSFCCSQWRQCRGRHRPQNIRPQRAQHHSQSRNKELLARCTSHLLQPQQG